MTDRTAAPVPPTTQITNIAELLDFDAYLGEFGAAFDRDAILRDLIAALEEGCGVPVTIARNGDVFADVGEDADAASDIDWAQVQEGVDFAGIVERHHVGDGEVRS